MDSILNSPTKPPRNRLIAGTIIFISGFLSPLFIPVVLASNLSSGLKTTLTGLLAIGIPEIFMLIAAAILGKQGFSYLKQKIWGFFKKHGPPDHVSRLRYRLGLVLFCIPLILAWALPYFGQYIPNYTSVDLWFFIVGDVMFIISFFVLGGEFWEKLRSMFLYKE
ncbi:MAG: hypothetical protein J7L04_14200 [Bacteroidales bacterium]|nr:hypothetical protein [Bacteroidales bacterium]